MPIGRILAGLRIQRKVPLPPECWTETPDDTAILRLSKLIKLLISNIKVSNFFFRVHPKYDRGIIVWLFNNERVLADGTGWK